MMEHLTQFLTENWITLSVCFASLFGVVICLCRKMDIATLVDVEVTAIENGLCKGTFSHSGKLMDGFIHPFPEEASVGDCIECELVAYDQSLDLWELVPVSVICGKNKKEVEPLNE